jgi:hypothetical protein
MLVVMLVLCVIEVVGGVTDEVLVIDVGETTRVVLPDPPAAAQV